MLRTALVLVSMAALGACASAPPDNDPANRIEVEVVNDLLPPTDMIIYVVHDGRRTRIGEAEGNGTTRLDFQARSGSHHLVGESRFSGSDYTSPPFTPVPPESFRWHLRANVLSPTDGGDSDAS